MLSTSGSCCLAAVRARCQWSGNHLNWSFETIYYWNSLELGVQEMNRVLRPNGIGLIANEMDGLEPDVRQFEEAVGNFRVYTIDEIKEHLTEAGFVDIKARHDEARHFICVTGRKPE